MRGASGMAEELNESVGKLVPQLALPEVLEIEDEMLELLGSLISLFREEIGDGIGAHLVVVVSVCEVEGQGAGRACTSLIRDRATELIVSGSARGKW